MIVIDKLKIAFEDAPKVGSTSIFVWLYSLLVGKEFSPPEKGKSIHDFFYYGNKNCEGWEYIRNVEREEAVSLRNQGYFIFCITRDPIKRLLSSYRNRVLYFNELNLNSGIEPALRLGLRARPTLGYFIKNLPQYQKTVKSISHHTRPLVDYLGKDISIYSRIFDLKEMNGLRRALIDFWEANKINFSVPEIPEIPRTQTGGPNIGLDVLTRDLLDLLIGHYQEDYDTFPTLQLENTIAEWEKSDALKSKSACLVKPPTDFRVEIVKPLPYGVSEIWIAPEKKSRIEENQIIVSFDGTVLVDAEFEKRRLLLEDVNGISVINWSAPSPKLAERFTENPNARNARFQIREAYITHSVPAKLFIECEGEIYLKIIEMVAV